LPHKFPINRQNFH